MTPAARIAAAIEILDTVRSGQAAEQTLTRWGRQNRYAGSKDRAAVRDHVYDVLRVRGMASHLGGGDSGRALMLGLLRYQGIDPKEFFTGIAHAPGPLTDAEENHVAGPASQPDQLNLPDWLIPDFESSLGQGAEQAADILGHRAPITVRVNAAKSTRGDLQAELAQDGILSAENPVAQTALTLEDGARRLRQTKAYLEGRVELQDAASQAVVDALPAGEKCLDHCAGGGGKSLAMAAQTGRQVYAHDINPDRMRDLPERAKRAGVQIMQLSQKDIAKQSPFDLVLCDAPCSGSGSWRRTPEAKWLFTPERLAELITLQDSILDDVVSLVRPGGHIVYATCSLLRSENEDRITEFLKRHPQFSCVHQARFDISKDCDSFFTAHLTQER